MKKKPIKKEIRLEVSRANSKMAYIYMPGHTRVIDTVDKQLPLVEVLGKYKGPIIYLDFKNNELIGIDIRLKADDKFSFFKTPILQTTLHHKLKTKKDHVLKREIELILSEKDAMTVYIYLPGHKRIRGSSDMVKSLYELLGKYNGPSVYIDFKNNELVGIEIIG